QARPRHEVVVNRFFQPVIDVEEATAAAGRRVAALQRQLRVGRRQQRDVLDGVLDVEVLERRHVEVGGVEVGLDQAGHDGAAAGVDAPRIGRGRRRLGDGAGVADAAVVDDESTVAHRRGAGAVGELPGGDDGGGRCRLHGAYLPASILSQRSIGVEDNLRSCRHPLGQSPGLLMMRKRVAPSVFPVAILLTACPAAAALDYQPADPRLKVVLLDRSPDESYVAVKVDTEGRLFVTGREGLFVFEPDARGGYGPRQGLDRFSGGSGGGGLEDCGGDPYVLTGGAPFVFPGGRTKRTGLSRRRLVWGVPLDLHVSCHSLAWGPEGDLHANHGDPLLNYGDFNRPDHWGHWTVYTQPEGTKVPYTGAGCVFRVHPDGSGFQVVAGGFRGCLGMALDRPSDPFT